MNDSFKVLHLSLLLAMAVPSYSALAEETASQSVDRDQLQAAVVGEVDNDGQQFSNEAEADRLRHRINEQDNDQVREKQRQQKKNQMKHQFQHRFEHEERTSGQGFSTGGSMNRSSGYGGGARSGGGSRR
ncbi:MAG: hypothetical protein KZQ75_11380 [Candidatus Thiodiazotropha sp. (ex Myrtea spinifera)]|nr:hypothetical protein [Candidatus Thiodiazotropha sp. (ex Myrtea spinifera)]MCU7830605.1 hypothetical protein [Candidatus Thiodiazotropha sp. (ex Myrtea sp. 'scaly one' KF741663)]